MKHLFKLAVFVTAALCCLQAAVAKDGAQEEEWHRYSSLSIAFPFVNHTFEGDDGDADCEFNSNGTAFDYSAHHVTSSGFTVLSRLGFAYINGDMDVDYGKWWDDDDEQWYSSSDKIEDFKGFYTYFKLGFGYAFELLDKRLSIIPTAGIGFTMDILYASYDYYEEEEWYGEYLGDWYDYYEEYSDDYYGADFKIDVFFNVMAAFMFTKHFGLSASFEVSMNALGFGAMSELDVYPIDLGTFSFMPAVGICLRF